MKCLNCGRLSDHTLCPDCATEEVLDRIFQDIWRYDPETCENPYLQEFADGKEKYVVWEILPEILQQFPFAVTEYYYCLYYKMRRDSRMEDVSIAYLDTHPLEEWRSQRILYNLLDLYIRNDFIKPQKWCHWIAQTDNLCCDLYADASLFFSMIGEYDLSDSIADKALGYCSSGSGEYLFSNAEKMTEKLEKQKKSTQGYRTKKPYWPKSEERRRAVAMFYDEKGIKYPRIESRPAKVPENEFASINECFEEDLTDYCTFWCEEVFSLSAAKCIYQIAAVKVCCGEIVDQFESFVRPWDARAAARKTAAKEAGVPVEILEGAEDVDVVMGKFFAFVGEDILVTTGALGNQAKLISRAARYSGMKEIKNEFYDLLDLAADTSPDFDLSNNTREYLLKALDIREGKSALEKALASKLLYDALCALGE